MKKEDFGEVFVDFHSRISCHHLLCVREMLKRTFFIFFCKTRERMSRIPRRYEKHLSFIFLQKMKTSGNVCPLRIERYCAPPLYLGKFKTQERFGETPKLKISHYYRMNFAQVPKNERFCNGPDPQIVF